MLRFYRFPLTKHCSGQAAEGTRIPLIRISNHVALDRGSYRLACLRDQEKATLGGVNQKVVVDDPSKLPSTTIMPPATMLSVTMAFRTSETRKYGSVAKNKKPGTPLCFSEQILKCQILSGVIFVGR
ncbi:hypothetical protein SAMN05216404_1177 [Nitrosospira multiformis]|uniref:Uncharacterized protein n=1 Tax=Nitrosospira multiformis TaxID=1231 RepID=A0A1H8NM67_9PROT|nr:hypothetical protein SAMN05216404_1177 [Nitrosospira multiformis]